MLVTHPAPHATTFCVWIKGALLLRRVNQLLRWNEVRHEGDPRHTPDFKALDRLIEGYLCVSDDLSSLHAPLTRGVVGNRASFPPDLADPHQAGLTKEGSVDRDLVTAYATAAVLATSCWLLIVFSSR